MTTENTAQDRPAENRSRKLPDRDKAKLWRFLSGMEEEIKSKQLSPVQLVPIVKASIGIDATRDNVRHALKVCDLPVYRKAVNKPVRAKIKDKLDAQAIRIDQCETRCAKLEAELNALAALVEETAKNLGRRWEMRDGRAVPK